MEAKKFTSQKAAKTAANEVMDSGWPAGIIGSGRAWYVRAHGKNSKTGERIDYMLGKDGKLQVM